MIYDVISPLPLFFPYANTYSILPNHPLPFKTNINIRFQLTPFSRLNYTNNNNHNNNNNNNHNRSTMITIGAFCVSNATAPDNPIVYASPGEYNTTMTMTTLLLTYQNAIKWKQSTNPYTRTPHPTNQPYQPTQLTNPINQPYQPTQLTAHPIKTPY